MKLFEKNHELNTFPSQLGSLNIKCQEVDCNTPFTPPDAKLVNKMLLAFENITTKFLCKFFFKTLNLLLKLLSFFCLSRVSNAHIYILGYIYTYT